MRAGVRDPGRIDGAPPAPIVRLRSAARPDHHRWAGTRLAQSGMPNTHPSAARPQISILALRTQENAGLVTKRAHARRSRPLSFKVKRSLRNGLRANRRSCGMGAVLLTLRLDGCVFPVRPACTARRAPFADSPATGYPYRVKPPRGAVCGGGCTFILGSTSPALLHTLTKFDYINRVDSRAHGDR